MSNFFKDRGLGFYFSLASIVLGLVTAIVYAAGYAGRSIAGATVISWPAFVLLLVAVVASVVMIVTKLEKFSPYVSAIINGLAFLFFIYGAYAYVSVAAVGIDTTIEGLFIFVVVLYVILFGINIANVFLKQNKEEEA